MKLLLIPLLIISNAYAQLQEKSVVDVHAHIACIGIKSECYLNPIMSKGIKYKLMLHSYGVSQKQLEAHGDDLVPKVLDKLISESKYLKKVVILAMDGYVDSAKEMNLTEQSSTQSKNELDLDQTPLFVPNEHVYQITQKYKNFSFGASINPNRKNALVLLEDAAKKGAVLVKIIPNTMGIDLSDSKHIPFYQKLIEYKIPLLVHIGNENTFQPSNNVLGDPRKLELPLKMGVKIIGAHLATLGESDKVENFEHFITLSKKYSNLYSDYSGLTNRNRRDYAFKALADKDIARRVIYGSDYPLNNFSFITSPFYQFPRLSPAKLIKIAKIKNPFDQDIELKMALGLSEINFTNYKDVLEL